MTKSPIDAKTGIEINPNRMKMLAQKGRKATKQALGRMPPECRYPILLAFLKQTLIDTIDEAVDLHDRYLQEAYSRAGRELDEIQNPGRQVRQREDQSVSNHRRDHPGSV